MLHLIVPFTKPLVIEDFVKFNEDLQRVCDEYGLGELMIYMGEPKKNVSEV